MISMGNIISSFIGAFLMFLVHKLTEKRKNHNIEKDALIRYFYNLHFAIRNLCLFYQNVYMFNNWLKDPELPEKVKLMKLPVETIHFNFNENELGFICQKKHLLYESIQQLKVEFNSIYESGLQYNNSLNDKYMNQIYAILMSLGLQIVATIQNINQYLIKYYKNEDIYVDYIRDNVENLRKFVYESIKIQKQMAKTKNDLSLIHRLKDIENIEKNWLMEF